MTGQGTTRPEVRRGVIVTPCMRVKCLWGVPSLVSVKWTSDNKEFSLPQFKCPVVVTEIFVERENISNIFIMFE